MKDEEIPAALQNIDDDKTPGVDGYNAFFFLKTSLASNREVCNSGSEKDFF